VALQPDADTTETMAPDTMQADTAAADTTS
jgi:hypothetical protein